MLRNILILSLQRCSLHYRAHQGLMVALWWTHIHSIFSAYISYVASSLAEMVSVPFIFFFFLEKEYANNIYPLIKWVRHYLGKKTNNEQVILFALLYSNIESTKEEITFTLSTHSAPAPVTAVACYSLCEMDTLIFYHCVYSFYQVDFCPHSLHRKAIKELDLFSLSWKCSGSLKKVPFSHL